jgi:glycosyltransferase involved in cell wall biosynthesis
VRVAIVHDYLTQRGGAERVVLAMSDAFPDAPIYTSLYRPDTTFPEFSGRDIRTLWVNRLVPLRTHHRLAFPLLGPAFSSLSVDTDLLLCSSSGWAHAARTTGRKLVYCHSPAKWLYRSDEYLGTAPKSAAWAALRALERPLRVWDAHAARTADTYLANSTAIAELILAIYGRHAEVIPPPVLLDANGARSPAAGIEPGFFLSVARPLPYKNVDRVVEAFALLPDARLVLVGGTPHAKPGSNVTVLTDITDAELRWLYANCRGLVAAAHEDFGLAPLEAAAFGKPTAALRAGGFLDTVVSGETGVFFDTLDPAAVAAAVTAVSERTFDESRLRQQAAAFSRERFVARLRGVVQESESNAA